MNKFQKYRPLSSENNLNNLLNVNKARLLRYNETKEALFKRLKPLKCLQSFLLRTMHDYISSEPKLSTYQRYIIDAWEKSGLDKGNAHKVVSRLYGIGDGLFQNLDKRYLSGGTEKLDMRLRKDVSKINWNEYFSHEKVLSPYRIQQAIDRKNVNLATPIEQSFLNNITKAHKKRTWRSLITDKKTKPIVSRLVVPQNGNYLIKLGNQLEAENYSNFNLWKERMKELLQSEYEQKPEIKLCSYEWSLQRIAHRIVKYDEATGDDPVFIYSSLLYSGIGLPSPISDTEVYKPATNEKHSNWRGNIKDIYPKNGIHYSEVPERPLLLVIAMEDDQYFSNETASYVDFGFEVARMLASVDPSGISSIIVTIVDVVWDIVKFVDWLDDDDLVGISIWELDLNDFVKPAEGEYFTEPYSYWPTLNFEGSGSHWQLRIRINIHGASFSKE